MNTDYEKRLGTSPMLPLILKMAMPTIAAQLINLLYNIVDRIFIGHIAGVGTNALAGVGITSSIIIFVNGFANFVSGGGAPLAAIALGNGDRKRASKLLANGFSLLILFTVFTSLITYIFMDDLLLFIGASPNTLPFAEDYLRIYLIGTIFTYITTGLTSFINVQGRPTVSMITIVVGALLNIGLDALFIFVFNMGVKGAATATVISQFCSAVLVFSFLISKNASLRLNFHDMIPDLYVIKRTLSLGISPFVMSITECFVGIALNSGLSYYGDIYVSALTVMQSAMQFIGVPISGFGQGIIPIISYNYGTKDVKRVKSCVKYTFIIMFTANLILTMLCILFPHFVASVFTNDTKLIDVAGSIMPVFLLGMTIFGLQRASQNTFIALGQAKVSLFIALLRKVILLIPLALILPKFFGVMGIYSAEAIADGTAAILCATIFFYQFPKIMKRRLESD